MGTVSINHSINQSLVVCDYVNIHWYFTAEAWVASQRHLSINLDLSNPIQYLLGLPECAVHIPGASTHLIAVVICLLLQLLMLDGDVVGLAPSQESLFREAHLVLIVSVLLYLVFKVCQLHLMVTHVAHYIIVGFMVQGLVMVIFNNQWASFF